MSDEEQTTFSTELSGLKEAAAEITQARAEGRQISADEPPPRELPEPEQLEWRTNQEPKHDRRAPILEHTDRGVSPRDAAEKISAYREQKAEHQRQVSEGDEILARSLGQWNTEQGRDASQPMTADETLRWAEQHPELVDEFFTAKQRMEDAADKLEADNAANNAAVQAELDRVRADRDAKAAALEQAKHDRANQAIREAELAKVAAAAGNSQVENLRQTYIQNLAQRYPEALSDLGMARMQQEEPARFQQYVKDYQRAEAMVKAAAYDEQRAQSHLQQQQTGAFQTYAQQQDEQWRAMHPEFSGERGAKALQLAAGEAIEAMREMGYSDQQIAQAYTSDPQMRSVAGQEAIIALGRQRLAQKSLKEGKRNPVPKVQRPGTSSDPRRSEYAGVSQLDAKLSKTHNVKDAGRLLAAMRRAAR